MRILLLVTVAFVALTVNASAKDDHGTQLAKCADDNEKAAVAAKDCAAFKKAAACAAELLKPHQAQLDQQQKELASMKAEGTPNQPGHHYKHSYTERKALIAKAIDEMTQAVALDQKAVDRFKPIIERMQREQKEAGCD